MRVSTGGGLLIEDHQVTWGFLPQCLEKGEALHDLRLPLLVHLVSMAQLTVCVDDGVHLHLLRGRGQHLAPIVKSLHHTQEHQALLLHCHLRRVSVVLRSPQLAGPSLTGHRLCVPMVREETP